jgi:uncharacterized NAD-dependent epimerase/dehydratase family protein
VLKPDDRILLFMEGAFEHGTGKMGIGILRYGRHPIAAIVDSRCAGQDIDGLSGAPRPSDAPPPVVASLAEAMQFQPTVFVLGIAPPGGKIPLDWFEVIDEAVGQGLSIVNGLHDRLAPRYPALADGQWIWDVREEPTGITTATGAARLLPCKRVLTIGTDMSIGKMTAGLELDLVLRQAGVKSAFAATGQTGMVICGRGVPLDAVRLDFAPGAIEKEVCELGADHDVVVVEGQGSLLNPASSATLPLIRGAMPTHFVLCHRAGMTHLPRHPWVKVPPLTEVVKLYQDLAETCGCFARPELLGVCLDTRGLSDEVAHAELAALEAELGVPATDPVRFGCSSLLVAVQ